MVASLVKVRARSKTERKYLPAAKETANNSVCVCLCLATELMFAGPESVCSPVYVASSRNKLVLSPSSTFDAKLAARQAIQ